MPAFFDYDDDYDPILNRKMKCEDPDLEIPKDHRVNALDCASAGTRIRAAEEEARETVETALRESRRRSSRCSRRPRTASAGACCGASRRNRSAPGRSRSASKPRGRWCPSAAPPPASRSSSRRLRCFARLARGGDRRGEADRGREGGGGGCRGGGGRRRETRRRSCPPPRRRSPSACLRRSRGSSLRNPRGFPTATFTRRSGRTSTKKPA